MLAASSMTIDKKIQKGILWDTIDDVYVDTWTHLFLYHDFVARRLKGICNLNPSKRF